MTNNKIRDISAAIFLGTTLLTQTTCDGGTAKTMFDEKAIPLKHQINTVSLEEKSISNNKAIMELSNNTDKPIYLAYFPNYNETTKTGFVYYNLECKEKGRDEYTRYGINTHSAPGLDPLDKYKSVAFEIDRLPLTNEICRVRVLYYDDESVADLINNETLNMNEAEQDSVDKAKKFVEIVLESDAK